MADSKITALTSISTSTDPANDPLVIVDVSDTSMAATGTTKKVTLNQLLGASGTATLASATITGDLTVDTSTLKVDSANNRVGIGTASPAEVLTVNNSSGATTGGIRVYANDQSQARLSIQNINGQAYHLVAGNPGASNAGFALYDNTAAATRLWVDNTGVHTWQNVGGVAGTAMTLNSTGLGVGETAVNGIKLLSAVTTAGLPATSGTTQSAGSLRITATNTTGCLDIGTSGALSWLQACRRTNLADNFDLALNPNGGNVGIGVTPINRLTVAGNMAVGGTGNNGLQFHSGSPVSGNLVWWLTNDQANSNILNLYYYSAGVFSGRAFVVNQSGNFMVRTPATPPTIPDNEMMVFNLTSNTNLRVSVKGTDGVTRVANITLA